MVLPGYGVQICSTEYLLAFSCKGRWFCPSCHSKKVIRFGGLLKRPSSILSHIDNMFSVFPFCCASILNMTEICCQNCAIVLPLRACLFFLRNVIGLQDGTPGVVMSIHTFGDYPEKFHSHIHAIASDGLFRKTGTLLWLVFKQISWVTKKTGQSPTRRSTA